MKTRKEIIQEMQMCLFCDAGFPRDENNFLAHEIGMHIRVFLDMYTDIQSERKWFINTETYSTVKTKSKPT